MSTIESMIVYANTMQRFLRDQNARLAMVPQQHGTRRQAIRDEAARQETAVAPLLLTGLIATIYVGLRIGLTYAALGH